MSNENELKFNMQLFAEEGKGEEEEVKGKEVTVEKTEEEEKKYSDKEVNAIIAKNKAKWGKKNEANVEPEIKSATKSVEETEKVEVAESPYKEKYLQSEVKVAMSLNGIDVKKIGRAVRLVDTALVINENGDLDEEKLSKEIADLIKEFPELKKGNESGLTSFGADGTGKEKIENDQIAKAFGNKK